MLKALVHFDKKHVKIKASHVFLFKGPAYSHCKNYTNFRGLNAPAFYYFNLGIKVALLSLIACKNFY